MQPVEENGEAEKSCTRSSTGPSRRSSTSNGGQHSNGETTHATGRSDRIIIHPGIETEGAGGMDI